VGTDDNLSFPSNQLFFWDDLYKKKVAVIMLKEVIQAIRFTKEGLYVILKKKVSKTIINVMLLDINILFKKPKINACSWWYRL